MSASTELAGEVLQETLASISTNDLVDELASRTKLGRIDLSRSQDAAVVYGRKGSSTRRVEQISGPGHILVVVDP